MAGWDAQTLSNRSSKASLSGVWPTSVKGGLLSGSAAQQLSISCLQPQAAQRWPRRVLMFSDALALAVVDERGQLAGHCLGQCHRSWHAWEELEAGNPEQNSEGPLGCTMLRCPASPPYPDDKAALPSPAACPNLVNAGLPRPAVACTPLPRPHMQHARAPWCCR